MKVNFFKKKNLETFDGNRFNQSSIFKFLEILVI